MELDGIAREFLKHVTFDQTKEEIAKMSGKLSKEFYKSIRNTRGQRAKEVSTSR